MPSTPNFVQVSVPNNEGIVGIPTVFTFEFPQEIVAPKFKVIFDIYESKVVKESRYITKPLIPVKGDKKKGMTELTFPESLAGATLVIKYSLTGPIKTSVTPTGLKIKRADGKEEIEKVYWGEQEHAVWGTKLPERREICKNEWAFLHIYTKGLFGHPVFAQIREYDNEKDIRPIKDLPPIIIRDNVISVPYSMASAIADFTSKYKTTFEGECLELYAKVHPDKTKIDSADRLCPNLFLYYKKEEKNPAKPTTVPPVKVIIADDEEGEKITTKALCSLEFRPDNTYIGDYGFDWIRKGDTGTPGYHHDHAFKDYTGKHYYAATNKVETNGNKTGDSFKYDKDPNTIVLNPNTNLLDDSFGNGRMYERLKKRYKKLIFTSWKDSSGKPFETYTPIMTLMKGKVAKFDLQLEIKQQPQKIVFEFSNSNANNFLKINNPSSKEITSNLSPGHKIQPMEIECTGEFDEEYILYARAFGKNDPKGEICGMLRILPNGQMYQHKIKIVLFSVVTNINGSPKQGDSTNAHNKDRINEILGQALITADIEEVDLDTTKDSNFRTNCCKEVNRSYVIDFAKRGNLQIYLENKRDKKYDNYYKIYCFDEAGESNGYSMGYRYTVCFSTANSETGVHELLHALEMAHPFDGYSRNTKFTHHFCTTDNIMDYGHHIGVDRKSLFQWQWQIINLKIR